jgi:hypothetical protein
MAGADRAVVVSPSVPSQAREFANTGHVEILALRELDDFLASTINDIVPFGEADPLLARQIEGIMKREASQLKESVRENLRVRQMLVFGHPLTNLNRILPILSKLGGFQKRATGDAAWVNQYFLCNAATTASAMLVRFAAESKWAPEREWSDHARRRLTYGDVPPTKAQQLARMTFESEFFDGLPAPRYTDEIIALIKSLITEPAIASVVPYALDFQLLGRGFGSINREGYTTPFLGQLQPGALKLGRRVLSVLAYAAEIPPSLWEFKNQSAPSKASNLDNQPTLPIAESALPENDA